MGLVEVAYNVGIRIGLQHMKSRTRIGFIVIGVSYVIVITAILAGCGTPFHKNWQINPNPGSTSAVLSFFTIPLNSNYCNRSLPTCYIEI